MANLLVWTDTATAPKYGVDNSGRVTATRNFLVKIEGGQVLSEPQRIAFILNDARIPKYNDLLFVNTSLPAQYASTPPRVTLIDISLLNNEPNTYRIEIQYGYSEQGGGGGGVPEDIPDETRERYPWEQDAEMTVTYGGSTEVVPESALFMGTKSIAQVRQERGTSAAVAGSGTESIMKNTAGDIFQNPPTLQLKSANISVSFSRLKSNPWRTISTINQFLFKVNKSPMTVTVQGVKLDEYPAGTVQFTGFEVSPNSYTDSRSWRKNQMHPFDRQLGYNKTKHDITVYKYYTYFKYSLSFEYQPRGYIKYVANVGFRELTFVDEDVKKLIPIMQEDGQAITEPRLLDIDGQAFPIDAPVTSANFQKYKYYEDKDFAFMQEVPWVYTP